jgi:hypothetical protein
MFPITSGTAWATVAARHEPAAGVMMRFLSLLIASPLLAASPAHAGLF